MNIVVLCKQVPDTYSERRLRGDGALDRDASDAVLDEINERAVEEALQLKEAHGGAVTVVSMGPDRATEAIRKALSMGADAAVHLSDEALAGSDAVGTARALAGAIGTVADVDLVLAGNEASDGRSAAVPAMVAEVLGLPALTHAREVTVEGEHGDGAAGDRRRRGDADGRAARGRERGREDQRAAVPVVQGDHGGEEEEGDHPVAGRRGDRRGAGRRGRGAHPRWSRRRRSRPRARARRSSTTATGGTKVAAFLVAQKLI